MTAASLARAGSRPAPPAWAAAPPALRLEAGDIHVWRAQLDLGAARLQGLFRSLSADERSRAERFRAPRDRDRYIAGRGLLRAVLARYLWAHPAELHFRYGLHGKPALAREAGRSALRFNVSHSEGLALLAVTRGREVGVDVERLRPDIEDGIARRFFSPGEVARLGALPAGQRQAAFFACWTRKEAFVKARGEGLGLGLDTFDVTLAPEEPAALLRLDGDAGAPGRWSLQHLDPGPGYVGALAVEGRGLRASCWQWPQG